jgi:hypothetical protein
MPKVWRCTAQGERRNSSPVFPRQAAASAVIVSPSSGRGQELNLSALGRRNLALSARRRYFWRVGAHARGSLRPD